MTRGQRIILQEGLGDVMRMRFDEQLQLLNLEMIEMGSLCEQVISATYRVLLEEDHEAAKEISKKDHEIDQKEKEIESLCLKLLLQQQPVARDLRQISAALKMITDMERIGDQASDIADIIGDYQITAPPEDIPIGEMALAAMKMVKDCIDAYVNKDLQLVQKVLSYDDVVDDLFIQVRAIIIEKLNAGSTVGEYLMDLFTIAKYYERIGDHATNIAEWVEFSITGVHKGEEE